MPNFGFLSPRPKATRVMFGVSTAAVLASGLPTVDDEDRVKLREGLVDEKNEKRLRKKSWVSLRSASAQHAERSPGMPSTPTTPRTTSTPITTSAPAASTPSTPAAASSAAPAELPTEDETPEDDDEPEATPPAPLNPIDGALALAKAMGTSDAVKTLMAHSESQTSTLFAGITHLHLVPSIPLLSGSSFKHLNISHDTLDIAAKSLFQTFATGNHVVIRITMGYWKDLLATAVAQDDSAFVEWFFELVLSQVGVIGGIKDVGLVDLVLDLFHALFTSLQKGGKDGLLAGFRNAMGELMQGLMDGEFEPMVKGLVVHREKELLKLIEAGDDVGVEKEMEYTSEWINVGMKVRKHSIIARGFMKIYVTGLKALEDREKEELLDTLLKNIEPDLGDGGGDRGDGGNVNLQLATVCETGLMARSCGCKIAQKHIQLMLLEIIKEHAKSEINIDPSLSLKFDGLMGPISEVQDVFLEFDWAENMSPWWDSFQDVGEEVLGAVLS